ncbi:MAG: hypothetical protein JXR97_11300, partial [Planctomycetes bacterium]|nr:hypothetical protein [Planctomycetota bacterium]
PVGGHNMMEPCGYECPTIVGPHTHSFSEPTSILLDAGGLVQVSCKEEFIRNFVDLIQNRDRATALGKAGREALLSRKGATAKSIASLYRLI